MSFYSSRWIEKTRKVHHCLWCDKRIEPGSRAFYAAGMGCEGEFWDGHHHPECKEAIDNSKEDFYTEGYGPGEHARGRLDDEFSLPPQFSPDYRGKAKATP